MLAAAWVIRKVLVTASDERAKLAVEENDLRLKISAGGGRSDTVLPVELIVRESCGCAHQDGT